MTEKWQLTDPLTGYIVLGDSPDSAIPAVLRDTGERVELTIPFKNILTIPGNWFVSTWEMSDGGLAINGQSPDIMPHELLFVCNEKSFALVDCRIANITSSIGFGPGTGTVVPTYVICGARSNHYAEINGLRTQWPDSVRWFNLPSTACDVELDKDGKCQGVKVCSSSVPSILVDDKIGLAIHPEFRIRRLDKNDSVVSRQSVSIETRSDIAESWEGHLAIHRAIKDLISIADWNLREFTDMSAMRSDDSEKVEIGRIIQDQWAPVISYYPLVKRDGNENFQNSFLFTYQDIGNGGIRKWINLRKECRQGMTLLSYLARDHRHLALETMSMLVGTALECVAWYVAQKEYDVHLFQKNKQNKLLRFNSYEESLICIVEKFGDYFPFRDSSLWRKNAREVFMGSKHPDAPDPDFHITYQTTMQSLIVLRMWLGIQLGVYVKEMKERLRIDIIGKSVIDLLED